MRKSMKEQYAEAKTLGYKPLNAFGYVEVLEIAGDFIVSCFSCGDGRESVRKTKIYYGENGRAFFRRYAVRYYLDEFMRI